ncbi:hypothetical protein [Salinimicrobium gaetbulicola]|uniref:Uncharacterized protein n=1 Tax=Salinimicrobium gaetbulicola TaxID=999702 RepID=A0ABW3IBP9_9FLAO
MKYSFLIFLFVVSFQTKTFGQLEVKSESEILEAIEWISTNPVEKTNKEFVSKVAGYITYQVVKYPNFPVNFSGLREFMDHERDYKYYFEINLVYTSNQLANKIRSGNKYDLKKSSVKSMRKVLGYYRLLLKKEPDQTNSVLDLYTNMNKRELEKHIKKLVKK